MRLEYIGESDRVFPTLGIHPTKGEVYEVPFGPDDVLWREPGGVEKVSGADDNPGPELLTEAPGFAGPPEAAENSAEADAPEVLE